MTVLFIAQYDKRQWCAMRPSIGCIVAAFCACVATGQVAAALA
jgi:hypothetical protein